MIHDHLSAQQFYRVLHPALARVFDFLTTFDPGTPDGRIDLDGDRLFALVQTYETRPSEGRTYEAHRTYTDLQYILEGRECIQCRSLGALEEVVPYRSEKDKAEYRGPDDQVIVLGPGDFAVFFPHDGHKPGVVFRQVETVRKVVFKILW